MSIRQLRFGKKYQETALNRAIFRRITNEKVYLKTPEAVIKALKEGKVVKSKNVKYRLIDGIICSLHEEYERTMWTVGNSIFEYEDAYIDEQEPLKIEVGKWYETRGHQKARCYNFDNNSYFFTIDNYTVFLTDTKGYCRRKQVSDLDIIGPWDK